MVSKSGRKIVMSGSRPTGRQHIGNYWGALKNWVELQNETEKYQCYFCVVDWHMLTTGYEDTSHLQDNIRETVLDWLAAGLDPQKSVIFKQSSVPEHSELTLLLSMVTPLSWLENNPTWKEQLQELSKFVTNVDPFVQKIGREFSENDFKVGLGNVSSLKERWVRDSKRGPSPRYAGGFTCSIHPERLKDLEKWTEWQDIISDQSNSVGRSKSEIGLSGEIAILLDATVSVTEARWHFHWTTEGHKEINTQGFLAYPVIQAADILMYRAEVVPVGQDQLPHLELSREIARRFNSIYGKPGKPVLPEPQSLLAQTPKVPGTDGRKMSKSYGNAIDIFETADSLGKKVMTMYTDPTKIKKDDPGHPEPCAENPPGCTVYALHKLYSDYWEKRGEECRAGQIGCVACKKDLLKSMDGSFAAFRERRERYSREKGLVGDVLTAGGKKAKAVAERTMEEVRAAMHLS